MSLGGREGNLSEVPNATPWKTNIDPENHWLVEANTLPGGQTVRVYVSFRECTGKEATPYTRGAVLDSNPLGVSTVGVTKTASEHAIETFFQAGLF